MALPQNAKVLDYGCYGWNVFKSYRDVRSDIQFYGADISRPDTIPQQVTFSEIDAETGKTSFQSDSFDLVVASHVIEHSNAPIALFAELLRVCKPRGGIYIEAPSDRSCRVLSDADYLSENFFNFWDDPTHRRPWTPAAFYRLGLSFNVKDINAQYIGGFFDFVKLPFYKILQRITGKPLDITPYVWRANKWTCFAIFKKPNDMSGASKYQYVSLKKHNI